MRWFRDHIEPLLWVIAFALAVWLWSVKPMGWAITFKSEIPATPAPAASAPDAQFMDMPRAKGAQPGVTNLNWQEFARRRGVVGLI